MMRGRFVKIAGTPVEKVKASEKVAWALEGDRGVTFAADPPEGSEVVAGRWWAADYSGPPLVSMEKEVAEGLGLKIGDPVVVNVLGRDITATVANFRKVNWRSYAINFVLVYSPNTFRGAPFSELVSAALPPGDGPDEGGRAPARRRARVSRRSSACGCATRSRRSRGWSASSRWRSARRPASRSLTSVLVLAGALAANRRARLADATILKILGATRTRLSLMFLIEYAILGAATAAFAVLAGALIAWARRDAHHARGLRLRLGLGARRRRRRPRLHRGPRHGRRLAHPRPEACGVSARVVIRKAR